MKKIYVADDDPVLLNLMRLSLSSLGDVEASYFDNGLDLYRQIQQDPPDAVVSDIILPKLEGLSVSRLVKFDEAYQHIRFMIISSVIDRDIQQQVLRAGADDYLAKPFRPVAFREKVQELIRPAAVTE